MAMIPPARISARTLLVATLCVAIPVISGCAAEGDRKLPGVYRVDVQQGNVIEQEMIDKLRPGMDRNQVRFIMGTPSIADPFHAERWDYVFTKSEGGRTRQQRHVMLYFKGDKLTHVEGDIVPGVRKSAEETAPRAASVEVPLDKNKPGVFSRMFNALPFIGVEDARKKPASKDSAEADAGAAKEK